MGGPCGSCWSFSATGAMEGANKIATGRLVSLSEQQLVSCDHSSNPDFFGSNKGCSGGLPYLSFTYVSNNGACTESSYPYSGTDDGSCAQSSCSLALAPGALTG